MFIITICDLMYLYLPQDVTMVHISWHVGSRLMVYSTSRPNGVTYLGSFNYHIALFVFGIMYNFLTNLAFNLQKFDTICTIPFYLGIMNIGLAKWEYAAFSSISCTSIRCISSYRLSICIWDTGNNLLRTSSTPSFF